ncbi:hypothetical protein Prudu_170S000400 [Prunus dulcis]|uniref:Uncharacterized protein n=1 Tax=Prunus dulcis TaxID=3755 RepID=A0A5H2XMW0_PRUDU|nr:hypothetical protein Prudu_170S000400 [Prunus dulcis]
MERLSLFLAYVAFGFFNSRNIGGFLHVSLPVLLQSVDLEFCSAEGGLSIIFNPTSIRVIRTVGARIADQVDQMSPESSEDYRTEIWSLCHALAGCQILTGFDSDSKVEFGQVLSTWYQSIRCDEVQGMRDVKFSSCHVVEAQMRTKYLYHFK